MIAAALSVLDLSALDGLLSRLRSVLVVFLAHFADLIIVELLHVVHLRLVLVSQLQDGFVHLVNLALQIVT